MATVALAFVAAAMAAAAAPGLRLAIGPIRISLGDPSRVAFQAALAGLLACVAWRDWKWKRPACTLAVLLVLATAIGDSFPRHVGDGTEYMAMAVSVREGGGPAPTGSALKSVSDRLASTPGWEHATVSSALGAKGVGGRTAFPHFWLYSALVAPVMVATDAWGLNPTFAFTAVNVTLIAVLSWLLCGAGQFGLASMLAAGPIVWWVDKAHAEVFLFTTLAGAALLAQSRPAAGMLLGALAAAQNPAALGVFAIPLGAAVGASVSMKKWGILAIGSAAIVATNPLYYVWLGLPATPLLAGTSLATPSVRGLVAPLFDTNLGLVVYAPAFTLAVALGVRRVGSPRLLASVAVAIGVLLIAFGQTHNVSHGGTPGMSRYALWLMAICSPVAGAFLLEASRATGTVLVAATLATTWVAFRPALQQQAGPNWVAQFVWERWPALDAPLPEVFAERVSRTDGAAPVPVATPSCSKILTRGNGQQAVFPFPCAPSAAPQECSQLDALCYVNHGRYSRVPRQVGFTWDPATERSWTVETEARFAELLASLGDGPRAVPLSEARRLTDGDGIAELRIVEDSNGLVAWATPRVGKNASLTTSLDQAAAVAITAPAGGAILASALLAAGPGRLALPGDEPVRVLISDLAHGQHSLGRPPPSR